MPTCKRLRGSTHSILAAIGGLVALAAGALAADVPRWIVGQAALEALVSDRTLYSHRSDGGDEIEFHRADGLSAYLYRDCLYRGRWWATDENLCYFYPAMSPSGPHCFVVVETAAGLELWSAGGTDAEPTSVVFERLPGNSESLPLNQDDDCEPIA